jgi:hypothetical protein
MFFRFAADLLVMVHFGFILYVLFGGLSVFRDARWALLHLPAAAWGAVIELKGWVCPLTPIENRLRVLGGQAAYSGDFIDHYLLPVIYPAGLDREVQYLLAMIVLAGNLMIYGYYLFRRSSHSQS